jgi:hypothetical protein
VRPRAPREPVGAAPLAALWSWLSSWIAPDGGVNGPVVHRADLKRMWAIHDTPWTQSAVIHGLLHLYRRSGDEYWLDCAVRLGDAQCSRQEHDGRFRWAGHEDDRFSSLVHNALADCALLDLAAVSGRARYAAVAERNLEDYVIGRLYRPALNGFAMAETDFYAGRDRFIANMNSVAIEALIELDRLRGTDRHHDLIRTVGERLRSLQSSRGRSEGSFSYSHLEPDVHIPLYTALTLRGFAGLSNVTGEAFWLAAARRALSFLASMEDPETRLWYHRLEGERLYRYPLFVSGAGVICNGLLDAARLTGTEIDEQGLARRLLRFQYPHGAICSFVGYDHPDNGRPRGSGQPSWEDVYPTPGWNAQAFLFLSRVLPPPQPPARATGRRVFAFAGRYAYLETRRISAVLGLRPLRYGVAAGFLKRLRYGAVVPGPQTGLRSVARRLRLR